MTVDSVLDDALHFRYEIKLPADPSTPKTIAHLKGFTQRRFDVLATPMNQWGYVFVGQPSQPLDSENEPETPDVSPGLKAACAGYVNKINFFYKPNFSIEQEPKDLF